MKFTKAAFLTTLFATNVADAFVQQSSCTAQSRRSFGIKSSILPMKQNDCVTSLSASTLLDEVEVTESNILEEDLTSMQTSAKSYLDDGFVFGLEGSGLERPKGKGSVVVVEDDSLETRPYHVAMVTATFATQLGISAYSISQMLSSNGGDLVVTMAQTLAILGSTWVAADLGSGVLHWSVDNYGNGRTPIMGNIIAAFQGHHSAQWTITERGFCNNVHKLCIPFGIPTVALINAISSPQVSLFFTVFCALEIMSQEFHKWSHLTKKEAPAYANWLQNAGLSINRVQHSQHHIAPYDGNYCIVSGFNNEWLDNSGFFRRLEHIVYNLNGIESNSWKLDPKLKEKTLRGEYSL